MIQLDWLVRYACDASFMFYRSITQSTTLGISNFQVAYVSTRDTSPYDTNLDCKKAQGANNIKEKRKTKTKRKWLKKIDLKMTKFYYI